MTQKELDAGGEAIIKLANEYGFGFMIDMDKARYVASVVLKAAEAARDVEQVGVFGDGQEGRL